MIEHIARYPRLRDRAIFVGEPDDPAAKQRVPELRMLVVAGPRIDPASLPNPDGLEVHAYVHDL
jgi:hypothetical protein